MVGFDGGTLCLLVLTLFSLGCSYTQSNGDNSALCAVLRHRHRATVAHLALSQFQSIDLLFEEGASPATGRTNAIATTFHFVGVNALLELPIHLASDEETEKHDDRGIFNLLVGDKRSNVQILQLCITEDVACPCNNIFVESSWLSTLTHGAATKSSFPVFSLAFDQQTASILVGGGDRYVSIWRQNSEERQNSGASWQLTQRLGPHTGWVKAVACPSLFSSSVDAARFYSIGCNRIESWVQGEPNNIWRHYETMSVDSNPNDSCTLSSDLLCLANCRLGDKQKNQWSQVRVLAAGGVDGRIHFFWDKDKSGNLTPARVVMSHKGRVNALHFNEQHQILFSVSHDSSLQCWSMAVRNQDGGGPSLSVSPLAYHQSAGHDRITALTCWRDDYGATHGQDSATAEVQVAVGTNKGDVQLLSLFCTTTDLEKKPSYIFNVLQTIPISAGDASAPADDAPVVTALCKLGSSPVLIIGHSRGLGFVSTSVAANRMADAS